MYAHCSSSLHEKLYPAWRIVDLLCEAVLRGNSSGENRVILNHTIFPEDILDDGLAVGVHVFLSQLPHELDSILIPRVLHVPHIDIGHCHEPVFF